MTPQFRLMSVFGLARQCQVSHDGADCLRSGAVVYYELNPRVGDVLTLLTLLIAFAAASLPSQAELVLQKEGDPHYHRPGCAVVRDGEGVLALSRGQAELRGLKPHDDCDPAKSSADDKKPPAKPIFVLLDESKYYHRDSCKKMQGKTRRVQLDTVKGRWPCPVCRPPIRKKPTPAIPRRLAEH
jgi:hypothetical protein